MKYHWLLTYTSLILFLAQGCQNSRHENVQDNGGDHTAYFYKVSKINRSIYEKNIDFLDSLINTKPVIEKVLLLISTKNDCISCVEKGSKSLLDYKHQSNNSPTFEIHFKPNKVNLKTELEDYVLNNKDGFVYDFELLITKYPTPILMLYEKNKGIKKIYCIPTFDDKKRRNNFLNEKN